jgi:hypothetical protein
MVITDVRHFRMPFCIMCCIGSRRCGLDGRELAYDT